MAAVWSLGRTKYHKIGHRGQNNDKCQYDSPICLNETESLPFVIKITKSVTHRSTPLFQKYGARSLAKVDFVYLSRVKYLKLGQPKWSLFIRPNSPEPGFEFDFSPSGRSRTVWWEKSNFKMKLGLFIFLNGSQNVYFYLIWGFCFCILDFSIWRRRVLHHQFFSGAG